MIENYNITVQDLGGTTQESDFCPSFWLWNFNFEHVGDMCIIVDVVSCWFNIHIPGVKAIWAEDVFSNEPKYDTKNYVPFFSFYCSMLFFWETSFSSVHISIIHSYQLLNY